MNEVDELGVAIADGVSLHADVYLPPGGAPSYPGAVQLLGVEDAWPPSRTRDE